jgi:glycosyltransferase involved in cell wall biosynthesis
VISTLHSMAETRGQSTRWRDLVYRVTDPLGDVTVAVSEAVAERHAAVAKRIRVIPNGVDTSRYRPDADARDRVRRELGLGDQFVWLAAGRLMWKKDFPTLLRALPGGVLLIAGTGPQEAELSALAPENVRFLGQRQDIPELMAAVDAFALSSVVEGLPMALLEAAASGLPCVATDAGGVREVVSEEYIAPPRDAAALGVAMRRMMALPGAERAAIGRAARERAVARFDMERVLGLWEELYGRY